MQTINRVNVPPSETWNYLKVNGVSLELPTTTTEALDPELLRTVAERNSDLMMGAGTEATKWIDEQATKRQSVRVPAGKTLEEPLYIECFSDGCPRQATELILEEGSSARVVLVAASPQPKSLWEHGTQAHHKGELKDKEACYYLASNLRIHALRGSHVEVLSLVAAADTASYLENTGIKLEDEAVCEWRQFILSGRDNTLGLSCELLGKKSEFEASIRYLVRGGEALDMNYEAFLPGKDSRANMDFNGVLHEGAYKNLRDTIDLHYGGKGCSGEENEVVLLAGENIVNKTMPSILCTEDDVSGAHGTTIGPVSGEQLAYLADRGLNEEESMYLFTRAVIDDAIEHSESSGRIAALAVAQHVLGDRHAQELASAYGVSWPLPKLEAQNS